MTVKLSPVFNDQTFDTNGDPAFGYKLFTYASGSSTKQTTYTDSTGSTPQTNPIILNASGYPTNGQIWLTSGLTYKFVLAPSTDTDPPTSPVKTIDVISGVNDSSVSVSPWIASGLTPTYISTTSFSVAGDQTTDFHVGRRVQLSVTAGTVYGTIVTSAYTTLTTITLTMDSGQVLDSGLSSVNLSLLRNDHLAEPSSIARAALVSPRATRIDVASVAGTVDLTANAPNTDDIRITGALTITGFTVASDRVIRVTAGGAFTLTNNANIVTQTGANIVAAVGDTFSLRATAANTVEVLNYTVARGWIMPSMRQTVLGGTVDSSGNAAFGGTTGTTTVTASAGTIIATAAAGGNTDYTGSIATPSWTGLSTNGTMYLYLDITSAGAVTTGSTTLAPNYIAGGSYSTTNNQHTYNIQEASMTVGNGSTATVVYRVFVGEVTVSGNVVTAITWYAVRGRAYGEQTTLANGTTYTSSHNIGCKFLKVSLWLECLTSEGPYATGDRIGIIFNGNAGSGTNCYGTAWLTTYKTFKLYTLATGIGMRADSAALTTANWKAGWIIERGF